MSRRYVGLVNVPQIGIHRIFAPIRNEPPAELVKHPLPVLLKHHRRRLCRADVKAIFIITYDPSDLKMLLNLRQLGRHGKPLTHKLSASFTKL